MRVAVVQMDVTIGEPDVNTDRLIDLMNKAVRAEPKPDVIVCPEMWNTGYALERLVEIGDVDGIRTRNIVSAFCRKHGVNVLAGSVGVVDSGTGEARNQAYMFNRQGELIGDYAKIHLFRLMDEHLHLASGDRLGRFELDGEQAGLMICYDIRFPEYARKLALDGAKVLFVPAQWPNPRLHHWRSLLIARAIENQMFVVACNRVGESAGASFFGHSMIIDPWGEIIAEGGEEETILAADMDLAKVDEVRRTIPVFADRRPEIY